MKRLRTTKNARSQAAVNIGLGGVGEQQTRTLATQQAKKADKQRKVFHWIGAAVVHRRINKPARQPCLVPIRRRRGNYLMTGRLQRTNQSDSEIGEVPGGVEGDENAQETDRNSDGE